MTIEEARAIIAGLQEETRNWAQAHREEKTRREALERQEIPTKKQILVAAYLRNDNGEILVRKRGAGCGIDPGIYGPPGGKVELNETLAQALCRELLEESGLEAREWKLLQVYDTPQGVCFFYRVLRWAGQLRHEKGHGSWYWLGADQLEDERVQGGLARWLGMDAPRCVEVL